VSLALDLTLNPRVVNLANLLAVKPRPLLVVKSLVEQLDVPQVSEVDEGISDVALVEEVDWEVKEVKLVFEFPVDGCQHLFLGVFVGDVSYHEGRPALRNDFSEVDFKPVIVFHLLGRQNDLV
jgi:hypothetical protein